MCLWTTCGRPVDESRGYPQPPTLQRFSTFRPQACPQLFHRFSTRLCTGKTRELLALSRVLHTSSTGFPQKFRLIHSFSTSPSTGRSLVGVFQTVGQFGDLVVKRPALGHLLPDLLVRVHHRGVVPPPERLPDPRQRH